MTLFSAKPREPVMKEELVHSACPRRRIRTPFSGRSKEPSLPIVLSSPSGIPNPGSKFRLFSLSGNRIALLHNPDPARRNPLALWISDNDMVSWDYRKILTDFPGNVQYPDGVISADERFLHFAFDYNRHDLIYWCTELPD